MTESSQGPARIEDIEKEREASQRVLEEYKTWLDRLEIKKRALDTEVCRLKKGGWWARLFN
jgi:hypothetical protein